MQLTAQAVSFLYLLSCALTCAGCHSKRSSAGLAFPPAEAAWLFWAAPLHTDAAGAQNPKQPYQNLVEMDSSPYRGACTANRLHYSSLIKQSSPHFVHCFRAKFKKLTLCQVRKIERNKNSDRLSVKSTEKQAKEV